MLELQEREIASYSLKKQFSHIVNFIRSQQVDKSMELSSPALKITIQDLIYAIDMMQLQRKTVDILAETKARYSNEELSITSGVGTNKGLVAVINTNASAQ